MITVIVGILVLVVLFAVIVAIAKDPGPQPEDVAVAYEVAWDKLDFESLYTLTRLSYRLGSPIRPLRFAGGGRRAFKTC